MKWDNRKNAINRNQARDIERHIKRINNAVKHGERYFK